MDDPTIPPLAASMLDYGEQDDNGIDLSLIRENLRLTPLERIRKAELARKQASIEPSKYGMQSGLRRFAQAGILALGEPAFLDRKVQDGLTAAVN